MLSKRLAIRFMAVMAAVPLAACNSYDNSAIDVAVVGQPSDIFETSVRLAPGGQMVRAATMEGLVTFDAAGRISPALADRWIVTDDGQSYIFRLRDGNWANGDSITAESAKKAISEALKTLDGSSIGLDLDGIGEVRAMAGRVIEFRLNRPMPYLLQLLAQPEMGLQHEGQGTGPMALSRNGMIAELTPINPSKQGLPAVEHWQARSRSVQLRALSGPEAIKAFNSGAVDLVLSGRLQDFMETRSVGLLRGTIQLDPVMGLFGLLAIKDDGFMAEPANREALSMAINRAGLIEPFGLSGWTPTTRIVTPSLDGDLGTMGERWAEQSLANRRAVAAARVKAWRGAAGDKAANGDTSHSEHPAQRVHLKVWLPKGGGSDILFSHIASDLAEIGVGLSRADGVADADLALIDDVARYPRAAWFLNRLACSAKRGVCSAAADARVMEASKSTSPTERAALLTEAEAELTASNVFIPFGPPIRWSLVRSSVTGYAANPWGLHPLMPLAWLPK